LIFLFPERCTLNKLINFVINITQFFQKPVNMLLDTISSGFVSRSQAIFLGCQDLDYLSAARHQSRQALFIFRPKRPWSWTHSLSVVSQKTSVDFVCLGQLTHRTGKVTSSFGVNHTDRDVGGHQFRHNQPFVATRGFDHHQAGAILFQSLQQFLNPFRSIGNLPGLLRLPGSNIQGSLGDINADIDFC